jgi:nicotinamide riboside transporter PnuC
MCVLIFISSAYIYMVINFKPHFHDEQRKTIYFFLLLPNDADGGGEGG